jgi:hypothetical protein
MAGKKMPKIASALNVLRAQLGNRESAAASFNSQETNLNASAACETSVIVPIKPNK